MSKQTKLQRVIEIVRQNQPIESRKQKQTVLETIKNELGVSSNNASVYFLKANKAIQLEVGASKTAGAEVIHTA